MAGYIGKQAVVLSTTAADVNGTVTADGLSLGDNEKAQFGAGNDLQVYSDGSNSIIKESGSGNLIINGDQVNIANAADTEFKARFNTNGSVQLYYDNAEKLATTSTGVDVTGAVTADGLTVDGDTLHVDATNNRVGIGTSSPSVNLEVQGSNARSKVGDGTNSMTMGQWDGSNNRIESAGRPLFLTSYNSHIALGMSGSTKVRIDSDGLKFNGDTAAANALDDYEEGTWTPTLAVGTATAGGSSYVKIGASVWVVGSLQSFSDRTSTSNLRITGLPFTPVNSRAAAGNAMGRYIDYKTHCPYMTDNGVTFYTIESGNWRALRHADLSSTSSHIYFSLVYQTTA